MTRLPVLLLLFVHCVSNAACMAISSAPQSESSPPGNSRPPDTSGSDADQSPWISQVVSIQKNGGHSKTYFFPQPLDAGLAAQATTTTPTTSVSTTSHCSRDSSFGRVLQRGRRKLQSALRATFLPLGFPHKTPPGYLRFSVWSWIQDTSTQLRSVLATKRILEGVGVGREGATALSALMNFLTRDASGMAATLIFTSAASTNFRTDVKRWRLVADLMVDLGITLEVAAAQVPHALFLPMICLGTMCKAICGVAAGACGGSIKLHWAQGSDISDINAKFGAQHTVSGAMGLACAALFARSVDAWGMWNLWTLYTALTVLHIYANTRCMRLIAFSSLNRVRMNMILSEFLPWWEAHQQSSQQEQQPLVISPPSNVTQSEPLFFVPSFLQPRSALPKSSVPIFFGESFNDFIKKTQPFAGDTGATVQTLLLTESACKEHNNSDGYLIAPGLLHPEQKRLQLASVCVNVIFRANCSPQDEAKAYLHAMILGRKLKQLQVHSIHGGEDETILRQKVSRANQEAREEIPTAWSVFQERCLKAGWDLAKTDMTTLGYEISTSR